MNTKKEVVFSPKNLSYGFFDKSRDQNSKTLNNVESVETGLSCSASPQATSFHGQNSVCKSLTNSNRIQIEPYIVEIQETVSRNPAESNKQASSMLSSLHYGTETPGKHITEEKLLIKLVK